jgi:hypothetical protein
MHVLDKQLPSSSHSFLRVYTRLLQLTSSALLTLASSDTLLHSLWRNQDIQLCQVSRTSPRNKTKRRARTSNNGKPETPSAREKRKRKATTTRAKAAAGNKRTKPTTSTGVHEIPDEYAKEPNPEEVIEKQQKRRIVPHPGKKRKQIAPKKVVVKGKGWETIEEIDDDSTYSSDDEVDKEEDKSVDSEDGKEKRGADDNDDNFALNKSSSDNDDSAESGKMEVLKEVSRTHMQR